MHRRDKFLSDADRDKKRNQGSVSAGEQAVRRSFLRGMPNLPEEVLADLFDYFRSVYGGDSGDTEELKQKLSAVVALFCEDYSEEDCAFSLEDWKNLAEIVNESALDLDDNLIMYIMRWAVEKGCFRE